MSAARLPHRPGERSIENFRAIYRIPVSHEIVNGSVTGTLMLLVEQLMARGEEAVTDQGPIGSKAVKPTPAVAMAVMVWLFLVNRTVPATDGSEHT
ncbi:hypothetical protein GALL_467820 [mine drainage metagenome]|uniref:Uncharacterized protein n=1 Tax=mine drainage metagenome TaxID=410659 RepID=A0A1J5PLB1_9ZZZZ